MSLLRLPEKMISLSGRLRPRLLRVWRPALVGLGAAALTVVLYLELIDQEGRLIYRVVAAEAVRLKSEVAEQVEQRVVAMRDLAVRWEGKRQPERGEWEADANRLISRNLQIRAIEWVDTTLAVRWVVPSTARVPRSILDPPGDDVRARELDAALGSPEPSVSRSFPLPDAPRQLYVCAALRSEDHRAGYLIAVVRAHDLLDQSLADVIRRGYSVAVYEGSYHIFGPVWLESENAEWGSDAEFEIGDLDWRFMVWPSPELMRKLRSAGPLTALVAGLLLAALCAWAVYQMEEWKRRARLPTGDA